MSERERWTIYPLLFLALGASLKDKLLPDRDVEATLIRCQQLEVVDRDQEVKARMNANLLAAPLILARDARILGANDEPRISLGTNPHDAPRLEFFGNDRKPVLLLATDEENTTGMVITFDANDAPHFMITASVRATAAQPNEESPQGQEPGEEEASPATPDEAAPQGEAAPESADESPTEEPTSAEAEPSAEAPSNDP